jgi:FeS assembly SUF system protein
MAKIMQQIDTSKLSPRPGPDESVPAPPAEKQSTPAEPGPATAGMTFDQIEDLKQKIVAALCTCFDPEIPVNIYELGLIYDIEIGETGAVHIRMTLTSPACPVAGSLPPDVQHKMEAIPGVTAAKVEVVWDPPWDKSRMSEAAKLQLGIDDW